MIKGYLVDIPEREQEAIRRLFELPFILEEFFRPLGLNPSLSWYLLQIREHRLLFSMEVDIIAGRFIRDVNNSVDDKWLPSTDYLVGVEAKCAYLDPLADQILANNIKSKKSSLKKNYDIQNQIEELLSMGFNKVLLLDIIANPPALGIDGQAWLMASEIAITSIEEMLPIFQTRLTKNIPAGHWAWSIGSVIGGDESNRGAGAPVELQTAPDNPYLHKNFKIQSRRKELEKKLGIILSKFSSPLSLPVILIDCRTCGKIHYIKNDCNSG